MAWPAVAAGLVVAGLVAMLPLRATAQTTLFQRSDAGGVAGYNAAGATRGVSLTSDSLTTTNRGTWVAGNTTWISPAVSAVTFQTSDSFTCNAWGSVDNTAANAGLGCEIHRYRAGVETLLCRATGTVALGTTAAVRTATCNPTASTAFLDGDRLVIKWGANNVGTMGKGYIVTMNFGGTSAAANGDTYLQSSRTIPFPATLSINNNDGTNADPTGTTFAAGAKTALDYFSLSTSAGTSSVSQVNVALIGNAALSSLEIRSGIGCGGALVGTAINNPSAAPQFTGLNLSVTTGSGTTAYTLCGTGGLASAGTTVNADVSGVSYSGTFTVNDADTANNFTVSATTLTIGNGSDPVGSSISAGTTTVLDTFTLSTSAGSGTVTAVATSLTGNTALTSVALWTGAGCTGTNLSTVNTPGTAPSFTGLTLPVSTTSNTTTYYVCGTAGTVASDTTVSINLTNFTLQAGSAILQDNDTGPNFTVTPTPTLTINNNDGTTADPAGASFSAGVKTALDYFSLSTNTSSSTVSQVNVALTGNTALTSLEIRSGLGCAGALVGSAIPNPSATPQFGSLTLSATTGSGTTVYTLCGTGGLVSAGTTVSANVSGVVASGGYAITDNDGASNFTVSATTLTLGNGSDPSGSSISSGTTTVLDTFTLSTTAGAGTVTAVATSLTGNTALTKVELWSGAGCTGTNLATVNTPPATPSFGTLTLPANNSGSSGTTYYICGTAGTVASDTTVSINLTGFTLQTGSALLQDNDTGPNFTVLAPAYLTYGNGSDPAGGTNILYGATTVLDTFTLYTSTGSTTVNTVTMALTGNTALSSISLWTAGGCTGTNLATVSAPTATPSFGSQTLPANNSGSSGTTYYICGTAAQVASNTTVSVNVSGVTPAGGSWTYVDNDTGPSFTVPVPGTITIANGANPQPGSANLNAGAIAPMNKFSLQASATGAAATGITVNLTNGSALSAASIHTNNTCTAQIGSLPSPVNGVNVIPITLTVPTASTGYWLCGTGGTVGVATAVSGTVTSISAQGFTSTGSDTTTATLTVQPSASITTSVVDGTNPTPGTVGPLTTPVAIDVDGFDVSFTGGSDAISAVQVTLSTTVGIGRVAITTSSDTELGYITTIGSTTPSIPLTTNITAAGSYKIRITPLSATSMPPPQGGTYTITARITDITVANAKSVADANSGTLTIDNYSPGAVSTLSSTPGTGAVTVSWGTEPADSDFTSGGEVVVLVRQDLAPTDVPVEGVDYTGSGSEVIVPGTRVGCVAAPGVKSCTVGGLTYPNNYYFVVFARDANLNYSLPSSSLGPVQSSAVLAEGSPSAVAPMVSIINPMKNSPVSGTIRVQIRVFNRVVATAAPPENGIATTTGLALSDDGGNTWPYTTFTAVSTFDTTTGGVLTGRTYEAQITPALGARTLRAKVSNGNVTGVLSNSVNVNVLAAGTGDGKLLVRDNSSQLCSDCHGGIMTHSSETTSEEFGSWATTCRDCHTAHQTRNLGLISEKISAPALSASAPANRDVLLRTRPDTVAGGFTPGVSVSASNGGLANGASPVSGACQVCHTRTKYYSEGGYDKDAGGNYTVVSGGHFPDQAGGCVSCHKHTGGLNASCTTCHGDKTGTRTADAGADSNYMSAPPDVAPSAAVFVTGGGEHVRHVTKANYTGAPMQCADCHSTAAHQTSSQTDIGYSARAKGTVADASMLPLAGALGAGWTTPTTSANCTNWCHGDGLKGGGRGLTWNWVTPVATMNCGMCHGQSDTVFQPSVAAANHPQNAACVNCHGVDYATALQSGRATHIDGTIRKPTGCRACHGVLQPYGTTPVATRSDPLAAPGYDATAVDTTGKMNSSVPLTLGVGAHQAHVNPAGHSATPLMGAAACGVCHAMPTSDTDVSHANGTAAWSWTAPATSEGVTPTYTAGSCSNYCHSNARPLGQVSATPKPIVWNAGALPSGCTSCHATSAYGGANLSQVHSKHVQTYAYACDECHRSTMAQDSSTVIETEANHVNGSRVPAFTTMRTTSIDQSGGTYSGSPSYTCASTYCHSDGSSTSTFGAPGAGAPALSWNGGTTSAKCDNCHGGNATATNKLASGSHTGHVNNATFLGANFACAKCHDATVGVDDYTLDTVTGLTNHVDGQKQVSATGWNDLAKTCASNNCHSSGQAVSGTPLNIPRYYTVTWNVPSTKACAACHGAYPNTDGEYAFTSQFGEPNYKNGGPSAVNANSHQKHATSAATCAICHQQTTANGTGINPSYALHLDGQRQVTWDATRQGTSANYTQLDKSCGSTGTQCHGSAVPKWGATLGCRDCHMTTGTDVNDYVYNDGTRSWVNEGQWLAYGHGATVANYAESNNPGANFDVSGTDGCRFCHDTAANGGADHGVGTNPFRLKNIGGGTTAAEKNGVCLVCHGPGALGVTIGAVTKKSTVAATIVSATHYGDQHTSYGKGGEFCWDCHDPHGDYNNGSGQRIANMIHEQPVATHVLADSNDWGIPQTSELAVTVDFRFNLDGTGSAGVFSWGDYVIPTQGADAKYHGVCQACHTATGHFQNDAWVTTTNGDADHNTSEGCAVNCHKHEQPPTNAFQGSGPCSGCHLAAASPGSTSDFDNYVSGGGKPVIDRDEWGATGHGATGAYDSGTTGAGFPVTANVIEGCYYCHAPDKPLYTGGPTSAHSYTTNPFRLANIGAGSTTLEKNGVCLVCHGVGTTLGFDPDGAGPTGTTFTTGMNSTKKVDSTHYGADHLLVGAGQGGQYCWDCHDPHGDYTAGQAGIAYMIQRQPVKSHTVIATSDWGMPDKGSELGTAVVFAKGGGLDTGNFDGGDYVNTTSLNGVCQSCHTKTTHWLANGTDSKSHEYAAANTPVRCVACHKHQQTQNGQDAFLQASACDACHAAPPANGKHAFHVGGSTPAYGDIAPHATTTAYGYGCGKCHATPSSVHWNDVGGSTGDVFKADVFFDWTSAATPYTAGTAANYQYGTTGIYYKTSPGTCATYCHSDGQPLGAATPAYKAPAWNAAAGSMTCTSCHGGDETTGASKLVTNKHSEHITTGAAVGTGYGCIECHNTVVSGNQAILNPGGYSLHVNGGAKNVGFQTKNGQTSTAYASPNCSAVYCHSNGRDPAFTDATRYVSVAWNTGTATCKSCHGRGAETSSAPNYPDGATLAEANSHSLHTGTLNDASTCEHCHTNTVDATGTALKTGAPHTDGFRNVDIIAAYDLNAGTSNYNATTKTCSAVSCHGSSATPVWGAALGCTDCHGAPPAGGKHAKHDQAGTFSLYGDTANQTTDANYGFACVTCHAGGAHADSTATGATALTAKYTNVTAGLGYTGGTTTTTEVGAGGTYFGYYTDRNCTTASCHSNGGPLQSNGTNAALTYAPTNWNATLGCGGCHGYGDTPGTMSAPHAKHIRNVANGYAYACFQCHQPTTTALDTVNFKTKHADGVNDQVGFLASLNPSPAAYNTTSFTCSSAYCHSNGKPLGAASPTYKSPKWTDAVGSLGTTCIGCHGGDESTGASKLVTNKHSEHITTSSAVGTGYGCIECHNTVVSGNQAILNPGGYAQHVDGGAKDVGFPTKNGQTSTAYASPNCSAVYCHSNGRDPAFTDAARYVSVAWNTGTATCKSCHGRGAGTTSAPDYGDGATLAEANSHSLHTGTLNDASTCEHCHTNTVDSTGTALKAGAPHTDGFRNVDFLAAYDLNAGTSNYNVTTKTCSAVSCHGSTALPVWGTALACSACHGAPPTGGAHAKHDQTGTFSLYGDTANQTIDASYGFACVTCHAGSHGNSTQAGNTTGTAKYVEVTAGLGYSGGGAVTATEAGANGLYFGYYTDRSCTTSYCHSNGGPLQSNLTNAAPTYAAATWNTTKGCDGCHGYGDTPGTMSAPHSKHIRNPANGYAYPCFQCHQPTTTALDTVNFKTKHADGVNDQVGFLSTMNPSPAAYNTTSFTCSSTYCHSNGKPLGAASPTYKTPVWNGTMAADCTGCHGGNQGSASPITTNKHAQHINTTTNPALGKAYGCVDCHNTTVSADTAILSTSGYAQHVDGGVKDVGFPTRNTMISAAYASPTCGSNYCHSSGRPVSTGSTTAFDYKSVAWNQTTTLDCKGCHGAVSPGDFTSKFGEPNYVTGGGNVVDSNSHQTHVSVVTDCAICHNQTTTTGTAIVTNSTLHTDGQRQVTWDSARTTAGAFYNASAKTCSSTGTGCHGTGVPTWGNPSTATCKGCHGVTTTETESVGANFWNNGATATINTNEWAYSGHGKTTGTYDVTGYNAAAFSTTVAGTTECLYCHDNANVGHKDGTNPYRLRGASLSGGTTFNAYDTTNAPNATCLNCHSTTDNGVDPDNAGAAALKNSTKIADAAHGGTKHTLGTQGGKFCWDCHEPHGDRPSNTNSSGYNILMIRSSVRYKTDGTYGYPTVAGDLKAVELYNKTAATTSPSVVGRIVETTTAAGTDHKGVCQACHDTTAAPSPATAWTRYWERDGRDDPDGSGGTAAYASGVTTGTHHNTTTYCISCHPHKDKFAGKGGGWDCYGCHSGAQGSRRPLSGDFTKWSHHIRTASGAFAANTAPTADAAGKGLNTDCVVCHMEGQIVTAASKDCPTGTTFPNTCTNPSYHGNGQIDLRNVDATAPAADGTGTPFTYDKAAIVASAGAGPAGWNSSDPAWVTQTSTALDPFCLNCHDTAGAAGIASFKISTQGSRTATDPFWDGTITNTYDQMVRPHVIDIKNKVTGAPPPEGTFSRHAIRGQSTSRYTTTADYMAAGGRFVGTWNDRSVMGCADCHTSDGANGATGNAHGSTSEYLLKDASGTAAIGSFNAGTDNCGLCHSSTRGTGHTAGNGSDFNDSAGQVGAARMTASLPKGSMGSMFGLACMNCHGGAPGDGTGTGDDNGFGWIHGTSQKFVNGAGGVRSAYRFMNGGALRYYAPGKVTGDTGWALGVGTCYTLAKGGDGTWSACGQHSGGTGATTLSRPLNY